MSTTGGEAGGVCWGSAGAAGADGAKGPASSGTAASGIGLEGGRGGGLAARGSGHQGRRPPEEVVVVDMVDGLERPGSKIPVGYQPIQKKGRTWDNAIIPEDEIMEADEAKSSENAGVIPGVGRAVEDHKLAVGPLSELDVEVREVDVRVGGDASLPEIQFSDRVHDAIDAKLSTSVVIRLLGKSIGYRALLTHLQGMWSPRGDMSVVDLDNEYYLVRFAAEEDYIRVLAGGPWVIYGSYLTVQPWSRFFSMDKAHPSQIMAWFRYIAAAIGRVVRVDYNMTEVKRGRFARLAIILDLNKPLVLGIVIDGRVQDIEYEGLPSICYKCGKFGHSKKACELDRVKENTKEVEAPQRDPTELYRSWIQVAHRNRRDIPANRGFVRDMGRTADSGGTGSRFQLLTTTMEEVEPVGPMNVSVGEENTRNEALAKGDVVGVTSASSDGGIRVSGTCPSRPVHEGIGARVIPPVTRRGMAKGDSMVLAPHAGEVSDPKGGEQSSNGRVATLRKVVAIPTTIGADSHTTIQISVASDSIGNKAPKGHVLPSSIHGPIVKVTLKKGGGNQGLNKVNTKPKKCVDRGQADPGLAKCLSILVSDLDRAETAERERLTIAQVDTGALDPILNRVFRMIMTDKKPDVVAMFEPRISGGDTDHFIRRTGFEFSYRVEAHGFSGGIWILWRDSVWFDVLAVSNQYVHVVCRPIDGSTCFFITFVYASPEVRKRNFLWDQLRALEPAGGELWVLGGDFNVISSITERSGGSLRRTGEERRKWSMNVFGHIGRRKTELQALIRGVEHALEQDATPFLENLEVNMKRELDGNWIEQGDHNTAFFHASTMARRRCNMIRMLKIDDHWCDDQSRLQAHSIEFFKNLFTTGDRDVRLNDYSSSFGRFTDEELHPLTATLAALGKGCGMDGRISVIPPGVVASIVEHDQLRWMEERSREAMVAAVERDSS
ncbi:hypothetical protein GQ457_15G017010 [Hibiscus cannabinus]